MFNLRWMRLRCFSRGLRKQVLNPVVNSVHGSHQVHAGFCDKGEGNGEDKGALSSPQAFKQLLDSETDRKVRRADAESWRRAVYPVNVDRKLDQAKHSLRPPIDPKETSIMMFPGQGTQFVGMGEALLDAPNVENMFNVAKRVLGYDLLEVCLQGPKATLDKTEYCQPAVFVTSLGALEKLRSERPEVVANCCAAAGFSVGEFAALVFAGCFSFEDALRLVKIRAEAMQHCSQLVPSGLMTLHFGADGKVNFACRAASEWCIRKGINPEFAVCSVSNFLFPHCKVIGGHDEALKFIELNAADFGIKKTRRLAVSGAFHTKLMKPAQEVFREALRKTNIEKPLIPVHSNIDGKPYRNETQVREKLGQQICSPVKWEQILHIIYSRDPEVSCPFTFECGPGTALMSVLGMVNGRARRQAISIKV